MSGTASTTPTGTPEASHLILHRPWLLDWLAAVSERQSRSGANRFDSTPSKSHWLGSHSTHPCSVSSQLCTPTALLLSCACPATCCSATLVPIKGDVEGIKRAGGRTEVLVTEGLATVSYALDDALVTFDTALKERVRSDPYKGHSTWTVVQQAYARTGSCVEVNSRISSANTVLTSYSLLACIRRAWLVSCSAKSCPCLALPQDLMGALATLEPLELSPETRAHWAQLAEAALDQEALGVAERCYAAIGDVAKARYLHKVSRGQGARWSSTCDKLPLIHAHVCILA